MSNIIECISKDGFTTETVLDDITLDFTIPADEAAALAWLQGFLLDVLKASLHAASNKGEPVDWSNPDALNAIQTIAAQVPAKQTAELLEVVNEGRRLLTTQIDERLLIEDILIRWNRVVA